MNRLIERLLRRLNRLEERVNQLGQWHMGTVTALGTNVVDVRMFQTTDEGTVTVTAGYPGFYAPAVNDVVVIQEWGNGRGEDGSGAFMVTAAVAPHGAAGGGGGGGGAPVGATYLVTSADATLTNEVVVGATPGGELGGTWASPTVDTTHSGSAHLPQADYLVGTADAGLTGEIVVGTTPGGELGGTWASPTVDTTHSGSAHLPQADYLVGTANAGLTSEIAVGTTPGGELGGTWGTPTVDATHSGSSHAGVVTAHETDFDAHRQYRRLWGKELRRWFTDLSLAGTQAVNVVCIGDSVTEGSVANAPPSGYSGTLGPGRWTEVFLRRMQQSHGTGRGSMYLPTAQNFVPGTGMNWNHSGTGLAEGAGGVALAGGGFGLWSIDIGANTANYIETFQQCDSFDIYYRTGVAGGMGDFAVKVDGQTIATVDIPQTGSVWSQVAHYTVGPGFHTIRIQCAATGQVDIEGGIFYNGDYGSGVHVWNSGHGGAQTSTFSSNTLWTQAVTTVSPSLVTYMLGLNDYTAAVATATVKTNMNTALDAVQTATTFDPSELIIIPYAHAFDGGGFTERPEADWAAYRTAMYEVAETRGAAVLDLYHLFGFAKASSDTADLFDADEIHLNERGHRALGNLLADALMGAGPSDRAPVRHVLPATADVVTPPTGFGDWHLYPFAGRVTPTVRPAVGQPITSGIPFTKNFVTNLPSTGAAATLNSVGTGGVTLAGTVTVGGPTAPFFGRYTQHATAATTNTTAGGGDTDAIWLRGSDANTPSAGFFFACQVVISSATNVRWFVGLTSGTAASTVGAADPGNHHVGFSYTSGTAWDFSTRDGTTNTKTALQLPADSNDPMEFYIWCPAGSTTIYYQARNIHANKLYSIGGSKTTNLPGTTTSLRRAWYGQTTEAVAKDLKVIRLYCESDR